MSDSSNALHEDPERLSDTSVELHRALVSLQEELEAVDWYRQRADACADPALQAILEHNMREEVEHAAMLLEWLRRHRPEFAEQFATYLNTQGDITGLEEAGAAAPPGDGAEAPGAAPEEESFTVGNLKESS